MSESRFPDGYMHYLYNHQLHAKTTLAAENITVKNSFNGNNNKKDAKPTRPLYVAPGARNNSNEDLNSSTQDNNPKAALYTFISDVEAEVAINMDDLDIQCYLPEARPLILAAMDKPDTLMPQVLEEIGGYIVNRAWEDTTYFDTAADLCVFICVKERHSQRNFLPLYAFLRGLMIHTQELVDKWDEMRAAKPEYWHSYVKFMIRLYRRLSERDFGVIMIGDVVMKIADALLSPTCLCNATDRELLVMLLQNCGKYLQSMKPDLLNQLINRIRDLILDPHPDVKVREKLIQAVELYACNWVLSEYAEKFYSTSVSR